MKIRVTWAYPVFEDNFDRPPVQLRISSNRNPGVLFPWGRYQVVYRASDRAGMRATCEFYVEVGPVACTYFEAPAYGARACNKQTTDSNGVTYEMICAIQCRDALVPVLPKSQRPWPDCAPEQNVDAAKKNFTFYTGSCSGNEQEALARIRENFLSAVKDSPLAKYLLCDVSKGQDCVVETSKSTAGSILEREAWMLTTENESSRSILSSGTNKLRPIARWKLPSMYEFLAI
ncbi:calcium ion binding [Desmophyllum pertusum]|uniref:Calcium ion binding n=1 Tax=Desmophyllum pertusum TaxID=174260 RepID=A0A9X0DA50_9CNID|nr:calcium ion binding [Desmophyllum pertusum]